MPSISGIIPKTTYNYYPNKSGNGHVSVFFPHTQILFIIFCTIAHPGGIYLVIKNLHRRPRDNEKDTNFRKWIKRSLLNANLQYQVNNTIWRNRSYYDATGYYINMLQVGKTIIMPSYKDPDEDRKAFDDVRDCYPECNVETVDCRDIARDGGVLNYISWNVLRL